MRNYFNLINTSIYSQKQKIEPLRNVSNNFYANETKAQSNYMDRRKI